MPSKRTVSSPDGRVTATITTENTGLITLDPKDEFEACLIDMVKMHREKKQGYGTATDSLANFYVAARIEGSTPIDALDGFVLKHDAVYDMWKEKATRTPTKYSDDAVLDKAVYAVLRFVLYRRGAY